jgi:general secretion pathway protein D
MDVAGPPSPPVSKVVPVRYMKADQMAEMITAAVPEITVQPGPQENSLLITANDQQWETIDSMLSVSDVAPKAAQATQAVYYVKYTSPTELQKTLSELLPDLAVSLAPRTYTPVVQKATGGAGGTAAILAAPQYAGAGGAGGGGAGGAGGTAGVTIEAAPVTALILSGGPYTVERGLKLLEQLDKAPKQVHIEAMVTEVNRDDVSRLGIDWFDLGVAGAPVTVGETMGVDAAGNPVLPDVNTIPGAARGLQVGKIVRAPLQWRAAVHALEETSRARILSKPSVTTLDGRQTALHTGDSIYYQVAIAAATTGGVITDTRTVDTGISLLVNPRVNDNGEVTLTIAPSVSSATFGSSGLPIVTEQAVVTTVRVKSGETAVLAGLVSDKERVFISKVPFLGDIPLAGELFKYRRKSPAHQELLIFVTPTIIEN